MGILLFCEMCGEPNSVSSNVTFYRKPDWPPHKTATDDDRISRVVE